MERIQQAIERARKEREEKGGQEEGAEQAAAPATARRSGLPRQKGAGLNIHYTRTRQVDLTEDFLKKNRIIAGMRLDERVEPYLQLRTQVLKKLRDNNWTTLAITSPNEHAGSTHTAINLAIALSQEVNQTVLLVDLDLRNPSISQTLGIDTEQGLVDYLEGTVPLGDILVNPGYDRLVILPGIPQPAYSSEILSSPQMLELHHELVSRYESRIIIYDLPALLRNDDALVYTQVVDAILIVVEDGVTTEEQLKRSLQLLEGTNIIGTVLNKTR